MNQFRPSQVVIHLDNLRKNFEVLRNLAGREVFFCPMVKANAYGHGDVQVAALLDSLDVSALGVGLVEEGIRLRDSGVQKKILHFGFLDSVSAKACMEKDLTPVLSSWDQVHACKENLGLKSREVHLKFDTGMSRLGFEIQDAPALVEFFRQNPALRLKGVMTHLHSAEDAFDPKGESFAQLNLFQSLLPQFSEWQVEAHALNSAGVLNLSELRRLKGETLSGLNLKWGVRPGLALYGVSPLESKADKDLLPVMSFRSKVIRVRSIKVGQGVSYSHRWKASRPSWIGVVPVGYADGYHRQLSNRGSVLIEGRRAPVIGNVCMDYLMVDLTDLLSGGSGQDFLWKEVTLFGYDSDGNQLGVKEVAEKANTIAWEILTSVGERVPRVLDQGVSR